MNLENCSGVASAVTRGATSVNAGGNLDFITFVLWGPQRRNVKDAPVLRDRNIQSASRAIHPCSVPTLH